MQHGSRDRSGWRRVRSGHHFGGRCGRRARDGRHRPSLQRHNQPTYTSFARQCVVICIPRLGFYALASRQLWQVGSLGKLAAFAAAQVPVASSGGLAAHAKGRIRILSLMSGAFTAMTFGATPGTCNERSISSGSAARRSSADPGHPPCGCSRPRRFSRYGLHPGKSPARLLGMARLTTHWSRGRKAST